LMIPIVQIIIREHIGHVLSWQDAGYWQAVTRISDGYLLLITATLSVYYLPKLSGLKHVSEIKEEMKQAYLKIFPCVIGLAVLVFIFKKEIIFLLFSSQFMPMEPLFLFQLLGDVFKIASWLVAYNMVAKAMTGIFIFSEVFFGVSYCLLSLLFIHFFGLRGVTMAFCLNYLTYWGFMRTIIFRKLK
jgi:O-antigen/teichoic acid export membrane protein